LLRPRGPVAHRRRVPAGKEGGVPARGRVGVPARSAGLERPRAALAGGAAGVPAAPGPHARAARGRRYGVRAWGRDAAAPGKKLPTVERARASRGMTLSLQASGKTGGTPL